MPGTVIVNQVPTDLYDADGNPVLVNKEGNVFMLAIRDPEQYELLNNIYVELRKMNRHLSILTETELSSEDIDEESL